MLQSAATRALFSTMPLRAARLIASLAVAAVLCSCNGDGSPFEPLQDGLSLSVSLTSAEGGDAGSPERLDIVPVSGGAELTWTVGSSGCLIADASALQSRNVVEVRIHRRGNPLALCTAELVSFRYVARVQIPTSGQYEIRLYDALLGQPLRPVGRAFVAVLPGS